MAPQYNETSVGWKMRRSFNYVWTRPPNAKDERSCFRNSLNND